MDRRHLSKSVLSCSAMACSRAAPTRARATSEIESMSPITASGITPAASARSAPPSAATTRGATARAADSAGAPSPETAPAPARAAPGAAVGLDPQEAVAGAQALAAAATDLAMLRENLAGFDGCGLKLSAKSLVFADGTSGARVMLVGEAPGSEEDRQGKPFVGRSGQLLDRMLAAIGLDRSSVYIGNVIPWRPPGNRTPTPQEVAACMPFIRRQIELADPDFLICLGAPSAQALMEISTGILKARGRWQDFDTGKRVIRAMATLHPAYLLRQPSQKRLAWRDLRALRRALDAGAGDAATGSDAGG